MHACARAILIEMLVIWGQKKQKRKIRSLEALQRVTHGFADQEDGMGV